LWLLLVVPAVWFAVRFSRTNFGPRQRLVQAVVRSLLLAALALALTRPVISSGSNRLSVVYLVDVSHSIASKSITDAAARIDALNAELRPDHSKTLAFAANVAVMDTTAMLRDLAAKSATDQSGPVRRESSDIDQALRQARAELLPGHVARIVLFTDGRATSGELTGRHGATGGRGRARLCRADGAAGSRRYVDRSHRLAGSPVGGRTRDRDSRCRQSTGWEGAD
jgi:hypothetical protein